MCALIDRENARPRNCNPDTSRRSSNQKSLTPPSGSHVYSDAPSVCSLHACTLPLEALNVIPDRLNRLVMEAGTIWGWQAERQRGCWLVIGALLVAIVPLRYCPGQRARRDQAKMYLQLFSLDALRNSRRWRCTPPPSFPLSSRFPRTLLGAMGLLVGHVPRVAQPVAHSAAPGRVDFFRLGLFLQHGPLANVLQPRIGAEAHAHPRRGQANISAQGEPCTPRAVVLRPSQAEAVFLGRPFHCRGRCWRVKAQKQQRTHAN